MKIPHSVNAQKFWKKPWEKLSDKDDMTKNGVRKIQSVFFWRLFWSCHPNQKASLMVSSKIFLEERWPNLVIIDSDFHITLRTYWTWPQPAVNSGTVIIMNKISFNGTPIKVLFIGQKVLKKVENKNLTQNPNLTKENNPDWNWIAFENIFILNLIQLF